jgi:hypothetical protein
MPEFTRTSKPNRDKLAINVPRKGYHGYQALIAGEVAFWGKQAAQTDSPSDLVLSVQASELFQHLKYRAQTVHNNPERLRKFTLGLLAQSLLSRVVYSEERMSQMHTPEELDFKTEDQELRMYVPEQGFFSAKGNPLDPRIHVHGAIADEILTPYTSKNEEKPDSVWYRSGDLYVRRAMPAHPSEQLRMAAAEQNPDLPFDYTQLQTLTPYLRSK